MFRHVLATCLLVLSMFIIPGCKKDLRTSSDPSSAASKSQTSLPDSIVVTPAGFLPKSHIHIIETGYHVEVRSDHVLKVSTSSGKIAEDFGQTHQPALKSNNSRQTLGGRNGNPQTGNSTTVPGPTAINWQTYAEWNNTSASPITQFNSSWVVPNNPTNTSDNQTIFIFNGVSQAEFNSDIMQPVLQWGAHSAAGGGTYWAIANWYGWRDANNIQYFAISGLIPVNPGTSLTGVIQRTGTQADGSVNYTSSFANQNNPLYIVEGDVYTNGLINGQPGTVTIPKMNTETWAFETLEVYNQSNFHSGYGPLQASDYPVAPYVAMTNIGIWVNGNLTVPSWTAQIGQNAWFGENTYVAPGNGEVDLYFHHRPPSITYATPQVYTTTISISPLVPTNTGGTPTSWLVSPALPAGLTLDPSSGNITGTPTAASAATNYTVTATNDGGSSSFPINITVNAAPVTINGQGSINWFNGNGSGSGTINAAPGYLVHVTISAYGPGTLTNFTMNGAQLSGPMGNSVYIQNNSTTQTFTMPSGGSVTWSGYFTRSGSSGTGDIAVN